MSCLMVAKAVSVWSNTWLLQKGAEPPNALVSGARVSQSLYPPRSAVWGPYSWTACRCAQPGHLALEESPGRQGRLFQAGFLQDQFPYSPCIVALCGSLTNQFPRFRLGPCSLCLDDAPRGSSKHSRCGKVCWTERPPTFLYMVRLLGLAMPFWILESAARSDEKPYTECCSGNVE